MALILRCELKEKLVFLEKKLPTSGCGPNEKYKFNYYQFFHISLNIIII